MAYDELVPMRGGERRHLDFLVFVYADWPWYESSYVSMTRSVHWTACVRRTQLAALKSPLVRSEGRQHLCQCGEEVYGGSIRGRDAAICVGLAIVVKMESLVDG